MTGKSAHVPVVMLAICLAAGPLYSDSTTAPVHVESVQTALGLCEIWLPPGYSSAEAQYVASAVSDLSLVLVDRLGPTAERAYELVLVDDRRQFELWTGRQSPDWIHALAMKDPPRLVLMVAANLTTADRKKLERTLLHELTHAYLHRLEPESTRRIVPGWFHEGVAVQMSGGLERGMQQTVLYARWLGQLQPLEALTTIRHKTARSSELAYGQAALAVELIVEQHGDVGLSDLINGLRGGGAFELVFEQALGVPWPQFSGGYQNWLRRRFNLLLALSDPNILFMLLPLLLVAAYFVTRARGRRRKALWAEQERLTDELNKLQGIDTFIE